MQQQIGELRKQLGTERDGRRTGEARIASTSVMFNYVGNGGLPGIGHDNPFSDAGEMLMRSGATALSVILVAGAAVLPWALLLTLLLLLWRTGPIAYVRRWFVGKTKRDAAPSAE